MNDIAENLTKVDKIWRNFRHKGKVMSKEQVIKVLKYGLNKGYKTTDEFTDEEVDSVLNSTTNICYKTNEPCKYDCQGLCKESY